MAIIKGDNSSETLLGTIFDDKILGKGGNDLLQGDRGNDDIRGGRGDDELYGDRGKDLLDGGRGNDTVDGGQGNDILIGSRGNDLLKGGTGIDTVDYRNLGQKITLKAIGVIQKGSVGSDQILGIENIIGAVGQRNVIDGEIPGGGNNASFIIDLSAKSLTVTNIPGIGDANFKVTNFVDVIGTANNDSITGDNKRNIFFGSAGNDVLDGSGGKDTADYSQLGQAITLERAGALNKGSAGTDQILNIETIVGAAGFKNTIDGSTGTSGVTSFDIDLSRNSLTVRNIPGLGNQSFKVKNFVNAIGTNNADNIIGNGKANYLEGGAGNDFIAGGGGKDTLIGVDRAQVNPGANEVDILIGGGGKDTIILGEADRIFYTAAGTKDFARILGFQSGVDTIQLSGGIGDYFFDSQKTAIFASGNNDLVAHFDGGGFEIADISFA